MRAIGSTSFNYVGEVEIKLRRNGTDLIINKKNAGLKNLFRIVCRGLAGYSISNERPMYVDLRYVSDEETGATTSCLKKKIPLTGTSYQLVKVSGSDNTYWVLKLTATIASSDIISSLNSAYKYRLYLMNNSETESNWLAVIEIKYDEELSKITDGTQALITWKLRFQNLDGTQEGKIIDTPEENSETENNNAVGE